jgi:hypothetical protein
VDIEEFYEADPRRRSSGEIEFGRDWHDATGVRFELSWVVDTGELYVMREPVPYTWVGPFGGVHARGIHSTDEAEVQGMTVEVVATVTDQAQLESVLDGWETTMSEGDSVGWIAARLRTAGLLAPVPDDPPDPG